MERVLDVTTLSSSLDISTTNIRKYSSWVQLSEVAKKIIEGIAGHSSRISLITPNLNGKIIPHGTLNLFLILGPHIDCAKKIHSLIT